MMQGTSNRTAVVGVFAKRNDAERALDDLAVAGFRDDQVGLLTRNTDTTGDQNATKEKGSKAGEGVAAGAVIGGILGAAASLLIPGIGPVVAGGILATTLGTAVAGAAAGGIIGGLVGLGVPEEEARYYEGEFKAGRTIVTVKTTDRYDEARAILRQAGAYDVHDQTAAGRPNPGLADTNYPNTRTGVADTNYRNTPSATVANPSTTVPPTETSTETDPTYRRNI